MLDASNARTAELPLMLNCKQAFSKCQPVLPSSKMFTLHLVCVVHTFSTFPVCHPCFIYMTAQTGWYTIGSLWPICSLFQPFVLSGGVHCCSPTEGPLSWRFSCWCQASGSPAGFGRNQRVPNCLRYTCGIIAVILAHLAVSIPSFTFPAPLVIKPLARRVIRLLGSAHLQNTAKVTGRANKKLHLLGRLKLLSLLFFRWSSGEEEVSALLLWDRINKVEQNHTDTVLSVLLHTPNKTILHTPNKTILHTDTYPYYPYHYP